MFPALAGNENDKGLMLETSASGQFTLSTFLIQPNYLVIPLNPFPSPPSDKAVQNFTFLKYD